MASIRSDLWSGKKILITGHTGFKGAWLSLLLHTFGAKVYGLGLEAVDSRALYLEANLSSILDAEFLGDIRDEDFLRSAFSHAEFDYVFHLAAQSLVIQSHRNPLETITTNIVGTANVLINSLMQESIRGISVITTDKVYENKEWVWPYKEIDQLGGKDVYSASKAASEIIVWPLVELLNKHAIPVSTLRAGNVIGGGDWAENRLIPDLIRASITGDALKLRNPKSTRPWQHVLDCLNGYLLVGESHLQKKFLSSKSFNFGPKDDLSVEAMIDLFSETFHRVPRVEIVGNIFGEHQALLLDASLAKKELGWAPQFSATQTVLETADWYSRYLSGEDAYSLSIDAIERFKFNG
jgi:CDP-glucose 4,6-dehydratase